MFDKFGKITKEEIAQEFGVPVEFVKDNGHSTGE